MIFYASKYGTSKQIASWLAESLETDAIDLRTILISKSASLFQDSQDPIFVLPLYAGGFYLGKKAIQLLHQYSIHRFTLVTVGLSDPKRSDTKKAIQGAADRAFPGFDITIFSTRGGIDYFRLSKKDSIMMWMLKKAVEKNPESGENQQILDTYGRKVSLLDHSQVSRIAEEIRGEPEG